MRLLRRLLLLRQPHFHDFPLLMLMLLSSSLWPQAQQRPFSLAGLFSPLPFPKRPLKKGRNGTGSKTAKKWIYFPFSAVRCAHIGKREEKKEKRKRRKENQRLSCARRVAYKDALTWLSAVSVVERVGVPSWSLII